MFIYGICIIVGAVIGIAVAFLLTCLANLIISIFKYIDDAHYVLMFIILLMFGVLLGGACGIFLATDITNGIAKPEIVKTPMTGQSLSLLPGSEFYVQRFKETDKVCHREGTISKRDVCDSFERVKYLDNFDGTSTIESSEQETVLIEEERADAERIIYERKSVPTCSKSDVLCFIATFGVFPRTVPKLVELHVPTGKATNMSVLV